MNEKIFLLEDDIFLRDGLCELLENAEYAVVSAGTIKEAEYAVKSSAFSLLILDVMLPDGSGFDFCQRLRAMGVSTPILFLTACDVTKPFKLLELLSRVRALIRRNTVSTFTSREIMVDTNNMTVKKNGEVIFVTKTEFQILSCLIRNSGVIITRATLLQNIWDDNGNFIDDNTLSVHMSRLREKIGAEHITTVRGVGYRWEEGK